MRVVELKILSGFNLQRQPKPSVFVSSHTMCSFAKLLCTTADPSKNKVLRTNYSNCTPRLIQRKIIIKGKKNPKPKPKAADWSVGETKQLLHA